MKRGNFFEIKVRKILFLFVSIVGLFFPLAEGSALAEIGDSSSPLVRKLTAEFWQCGRGKYRKFQSLIERGKCAEAKKLARSISKLERNAEFFVALCFFHRKLYKEALPLFKKSASKGGIFKDYALYYTGRVYEKIDDKRASQYYLKVSENSPLRAKAERRGVELLLKYGRFRLASKVLGLRDSYLRQFSIKRKGKSSLKNDKKSNVRKKKKFIRRVFPRPLWELYLKWKVARHLSRRKKEGAREASVYFARRIWTAYPMSSESDEVDRWLAKNRVEITTEERLERGMRMIGMFSYKRAIATLKPLNKAKLSRKVACLLDYSLGFAHFRLRKYSRAIPYFMKAEKLCRRAGDYFKVRILYYLGQSYLRRGKVAGAAPYLRRLWRSYPKHFLADDAVFLLADAYQRRKKTAKADKLFSFLLKKFPAGDMTHSAIWRKAYLAYSAGNYRKALSLFKKLYSRKSGKNRHRMGAIYFAARSYQKMGKKYLRKAAELYVKLVKERPFSYYSSLALLRLARIYRTRRPQLATCRWIKKNGNYLCANKSYIKKDKNDDKSKKKSRKKSLNWSYVSSLWGEIPSDRPLLSLKWPSLWRGKAPFFRTSVYRRGRAFICHGFRELARRELRKILNCRYRVPAYRSWPQLLRPARSYCSPPKEGMPKLAAALFFAGEYHLSQVVLRRYVSVRGRPLRGEARGLWYLSYPRPFYSIALRESKRRKVPLYLIYAIMREESVFQEDVQSFANAYGLMQLLLSTARMEFRVWKERPFKRKLVSYDLLRAEINIPLGTLHLRRLSKIFSGQLPLIAGGYNAGVRWVRRWLKKSGQLPLDEWVEAVTIRQTRHYIKRVLNSFVTYNLLYRAGKVYLLPDYVWPDYKFKFSGRKK